MLYVENAAKVGILCIACYRCILIFFMSFVESGGLFLPDG
ncbi:hypothetical protein HMPREF2141_01896 [Bacteroides uniformis]|uniref:Uncharacterized protein n=2 Tax=Bacteroides uniformis TaxID=820 RepID=A0ABC9NH72_BACUC|nr:hypothetical protein BACUNI_00217 [Bacteroides uniformis ATCC 8492]KDS56770.1 putative membrane protein [Bacteroides uniformis str. 3978 T3 ii]KXT35409.1 hypothetical protein HMPREF2141_01896 [Bacteroides uniformis]